MRTPAPARPDGDAALCDVAEVAEVMAALASPSRIAIIRVLGDRELDVGEIATAVGMSVATTSHHLVLLRRARLVVTRRDGTRRLNRLAGPHVTELCAAACATVHYPAARTARR